MQSLTECTCHTLGRTLFRLTDINRKNRKFNFCRDIEGGSIKYCQFLYKLKPLGCDKRLVMSYKSTYNFLYIQITAAFHQ